MLSVSRPMLVVVLKAWVTEMNETPCASTSSTSLANSASAAGQPIDLVDDDHVDPSGVDMVQWLRKGGPFHRKAPSS
jgi:hypothetical protein